MIAWWTREVGQSSTLLLSSSETDMLGEAGLKHRAWRFQEVSTRPLASTLSPARLRGCCVDSHVVSGRRRANMAVLRRSAHAEGGGSGDVSTEGHTSGLETRGCSEFLVLVTTPKVATRRGYLSPQSTHTHHRCRQVASVVSDSVRPHRRHRPGAPVPGVLQARTLEWVAIAFSSA